MQEQRLAAQRRALVAQQELLPEEVAVQVWLS
jgi:hypothetical protein